MKIRISLIALAALAGTAQAEDSHYYGRWTMADPSQQLSSQAKPYKTLDINLCTAGSDYCAVSVSDAGKCGATLVHLSRKDITDAGAQGIALWGAERHDATAAVEPLAGSDKLQFSLYIGRGHDFHTRRGSMPNFDVAYSSMGEPKCRGK